MLDDIIRAEFYQSEAFKIHSAGDVEQWIAEFETIKQEVNHFLVRELMDEARWNEKLCYERDQQADLLAIE